MGKKHGKIEGVDVFSAKNVWKSSIDGGFNGKLPHVFKGNKKYWKPPTCNGWYRKTYRSFGVKIERLQKS